MKEDVVPRIMRIPSYKSTYFLLPLRHGRSGQNACDAETENTMQQSGGSNGIREKGKEKNQRIELNVGAIL